jgi:hypothetical protein
MSLRVSRRLKRFSPSRPRANCSLCSGVTGGWPGAGPSTVWTRNSTGSGGTMCTSLAPALRPMISHSRNRSTSCSF